MTSASLPIRALCTLLGIAVLATGVEAQRAASTPGPLGFDVASVKLGMSPQEAQAALAKSAYRIKRIAKVPSFDQEARAEAARRQGVRSPLADWKGVNSITATGPHQEYMEVSFLQRQEGSRVGGVTLDVPTTAITRDDFERQIAVKYGAAGASRQRTEMSWCSAEVGTNCGRSYVASGPLETDLPLLTATLNAVGGGRLWLRLGRKADVAQHAALESETVRLAPKTDRAAF